MKTVLALIDFSPRAEDAARFAMHLAIKNKANLVLCHAIEVTQQYATHGAEFNWPVADNLDSKDESIRALKDLGKKLKYELAFEDFTPTVCCIADISPLSELTKRVIKEKSVDLIVIGSHKSQGWARFLYGSHTHSLLDKVNCPVLLVPEKLVFKGLSNISYATDLTFNNSLVIQYLIKIARSFHAKISVNHVSLLQFPVTESEHAIENAYLHELEADSPEIIYQTIKGDDVKSSLIEITDSGNIDMLALVHKRYDFFANLFHASISKQLAGVAKIPLLVLPYSFSLGFDFTNDQLDNFCYKTVGTR